MRFDVISDWNTVSDDDADDANNDDDDDDNGKGEF